MADLSQYVDMFKLAQLQPLRKTREKKRGKQEIKVLGWGWGGWWGLETPNVGSINLFAQL